MGTSMADSPDKNGDKIQMILDKTAEAKAAALAAQNASSVEELKEELDKVMVAVWGVPSGLKEKNYKGAATRHGWKNRWQVSFDDFGPKYKVRYSTIRPPQQDTDQLGIIGIGRALRHELTSIVEDSTKAEDLRLEHKYLIASLNNVIGWMKIDDGFIKAEYQPRVDLTRVWNADKSFWNSTADTGWLQEAFSQALNILKTDYGDKLDMAKKHAADLIMLLEKVETGMDADNDGTVEARMMEGGLAQVEAQAKKLGLL